MKKAIVSAVVVGLVAGAMVMPAEAGKKKKKPVRVEAVVEVPYTGGELGANTPGPSGGACLNGTPAFNCKTIVPPGTGFGYIKIEVKDASGMTVGGFLAQQDKDGDTIQDGYGNFCGAHPEPIALEVPDTVVGISLYPGVCTTGEPSTPTTGTIVATFSNMP